MAPSNPDNASAGANKEVVHVDASFEPLIPKFMANRKQEVVAMQEAILAQDFDSVRNLSHGMKGAGGSYGFDRVTEMAAIIEQAAKDKTSATIHDTLTALGSYLERIEVVFEEDLS